MTRERIARPVTTGLSVGQLAGFGFAAIFALAGIGCNTASVDAGGAGGTAGGAGATGNTGTSGASGSGTGGIHLGPSSGTGGGGGSAKVCNATSTSGCQAQIPEGCGDGINNQNGIEQCDDGNVLPGDGCNGVCQVEPNWNCPPDGGPARERSSAATASSARARFATTATPSTATAAIPPARFRTPPTMCRRTTLHPHFPVWQQAHRAGRKLRRRQHATAAMAAAAVASSRAGWVCPTPGNPCKPAPRCGDGIVQPSLGEVCDDGNTKDGDGCSADCKTKGPGCVCTPASCASARPSSAATACIEGSEKCDDGNTEAAMAARRPARSRPDMPVPSPMPRACPTVATASCSSRWSNAIPRCRDTHVAEACSSTCKFNPGWACTGNPPSNCHQTVCGDGKVEGSEGCDDGNTLPNDGCSPTCHAEPNCDSATGTCTSKCGDGLVVNEGCDDGNTNNGDGCSSTCKVEPGYQCAQPDSDADTMTVPVTYRDFLLGGDFYAATISGSNNAITGMVQGTLDSDGKPVYAGAGGGSTTAGGSRVRPASTIGTGTCRGPTPPTYRSSLLHNNGNGAFVNWWKDNQEWMSYFQCSLVCGRELAPTATLPAYVNDGTMQCFASVHALGRRQHESLRGQPATGPWQPTLLPARQRARHDHADLRLCARRDPAHV